MCIEIHERGDEEGKKEEERPWPIDKRYAGNNIFLNVLLWKFSNIQKSCNNYSKPSFPTFYH